MKRLIILIVGAALIQGCAYSTISRQSGGYGRVMHNEKPIIDALVSLKDLDGIESVNTDAQGKFRIKPKGSKVFYCLMSNPVFHEIVLKIEKNGYLPKEISIKKSVFGKNDYDFGDIVLHKDK